GQELVAGGGRASRCRDSVYERERPGSSHRPCRGRFGHVYRGRARPLGDRDPAEFLRDRLVRAPTVHSPLRERPGGRLYRRFLVLARWVRDEGSVSPPEQERRPPLSGEVSERPARPGQLDQLELVGGGVGGGGSFKIEPP